MLREGCIACRAERCQLARLRVYTDQPRRLQNMLLRSCKAAAAPVSTSPPAAKVPVGSPSADAAAIAGGGCGCFPARGQADKRLHPEPQGTHGVLTTAVAAADAHASDEVSDMELAGEEVTKSDSAAARNGRAVSFGEKPTVLEEVIRGRWPKASRRGKGSPVTPVQLPPMPRPVAGQVEATTSGPSLAEDFTFSGQQQGGAGAKAVAAPKQATRPATGASLPELLLQTAEAVRSCPDLDASGDLDALGLDVEDCRPDAACTLQLLLRAPPAQSSTGPHCRQTSHLCPLSYRTMHCDSCC